MPRRALIFKVPKGKEVHYSNPWESLGTILSWLRLLHAISYFARSIRRKHRINRQFEHLAGLSYWSRVGESCVRLETTDPSCRRVGFVGGIRVPLCNVGWSRDVRIFPCRCTRGSILPMVRDSRNPKMEMVLFPACCFVDWVRNYRPRTL